jgi:hypothetical protein
VRSRSATPASDLAPRHDREIEAFRREDLGKRFADP